ncbi:hypothetical protein B0H13DRAFT_1854779 [Mycena leptocephala]|nr:hypothetical protein B0H13DRAFT_1854779 [Mycena leptocephala]
MITVRDLWVGTDHAGDYIETCQKSTPSRGRAIYNQPWAPATNMNPFTNPVSPVSSADHNTLVASGNQTYSNLLALHSELSAKYTTLQAAYVTLATAIPTIFQFILNPFNIPPPSASDASLVSNSLNKVFRPRKDDFPLVLYWERSDFKSSSDSDLTTISDDKNPKLAFLEHNTGEEFTLQEISDLRSHLRSCFTTLLDRGIAPSTWSRASCVATNWLRTEMLNYCPDLALCAANWKVDALTTEVYSQWTRSRREQIAAASTTASAKRKAEESDSSRSEIKINLFLSNGGLHKKG